MPTVKKIIADLRALSPEQLKIVRDEVWPRKYGRDKADSKLRRRVTRQILMELMTEDGIPFFNWEMKLTPKQVDALPLDAWKSTMKQHLFCKSQGVGQRLIGKDEFESWVVRRKEKLKEWETLTMGKLLDLVDERIPGDPERRKKRLNTRKGEFIKNVRKEKDEFLLSWHGLPWEGIPPALRDKRQPVFQGDPTLYTKSQYEWLYPPILRAS